MKKHISRLFRAGVLGAALFTAAASTAQTAPRTSYFLDGYTFRHELNPAFSGERNYFSIPVLANIGVGAYSNVGVNTFLYKLPGTDRLTTFMSPTVGASEFLGKLHANNHINADLNLTILSTGFRAFKGYNTITIGTRAYVGANIPKDLFAFMKLGQTGPDTRYSFENLRVQANAVAEIALGHSHKINSKLEVGAKVKVLLGAGNVDARISRMDVVLSDKVWRINARGTVDLAAGSGLYVPTKAEVDPSGSYTPEEATEIEWNDVEYNNFGLGGFGLGFDLGATYNLLPDLQLSLAVRDLGFMKWNNAVRGETPLTEWTFEGFKDVALNSDQPGYEDNKLESQLDNLRDDLEDCVNFHRTSADGGSYTQALKATIHLGAEYKMPFYRKLTAGFLFTSYIAGCMSMQEGRFFATVKPAKWFDATINYGVGTYGNSFGWMLNFHPRGFNFFIGTDHQIFKVTPQYVPVGHATGSINLGFNVTFGS